MTAVHCVRSVWILSLILKSYFHSLLNMQLDELSSTDRLATTTSIVWFTKGVKRAGPARLGPARTGLGPHGPARLSP